MPMQKPRSVSVRGSRVAESAMLHFTSRYAFGNRRDVRNERRASLKCFLAAHWFRRTAKSSGNVRFISFLFFLSFSNKFNRCGKIRCGAIARSFIYGAESTARPLSSTVLIEFTAIFSCFQLLPWQQLTFSVEKFVPCPFIPRDF